MANGCPAPLNVAVEYEELDFENAFAHQTKYRGPPTPELEEAWAELWFCKSLNGMEGAEIPLLTWV